MNKKTFLTSFSLAFISILICLCICELTMRMIGKIEKIDFRLYMKEIKNSDRLPKGLYISDDILQWRPAHNFQALATTSDFSVIYKINSKGLRDKEYDYIKSANKVRMLAFGDSFTFGEGVAYGDRFTDIPEKYFPNLEIINFGVPGYGLDQMLLYFATEGIKYSPDYLIIFMHNYFIERYSTDIIKKDSVVLENISYNTPSGGKKTAYLKQNDNLFIPEKNIILRNSYFLSFLKYRITLFMLKNKLKQDDKNLWAGIINKADQKRKEDNNKNINTPPKSIQDLSGADPVKYRTVLLVKKFNEICKGHSIKFIIINISAGANMDYLKNIDNGISYYDISNDIMQESKKYNLFFTYDGHYNKKTHAFIAKKITELIKQIIF